MNKLNSANDKTKNNSASNGHKKPLSVKNEVEEKFADETKKSMSEADQLTLRAWKKTFENRKKAA
jgi:hypothetical protein